MFVDLFTGGGNVVANVNAKKRIANDINGSVIDIFKTFQTRAWECPVCRSHIDRDYNAALNILEEGIRIYKENIGLSSPEFTHVDCPTVDDRCSYNLKSSGRLNREKHVFQ